MNLGEILTQARLELDDTQADYLWSDSELIAYANEAQEQACRRSRLIIDSSTVEICEIAIVANTALYSLDERILAIKDVVDAEGSTITGATVGWMNENVSGWRNSTGTPKAVITDFETDKLRLYPIPRFDSTINLRVVRTQLNNMVGLQDKPEIKSRYHMALIHWIKHRAYLKKDADTLDKNASIEALTLFAREFGEARPAYNIEFDLNNLPYDSLDGSF
jgi:hypothetical protein